VTFRSAPSETRGREPGAVPWRVCVLSLLTVQALGVAAMVAGGHRLEEAAPDGTGTAAAIAPAAALPSYALAGPDLRVTLPARLQEVSGVTALSDTEVACVQDEEGAVFVYDLGKRRVTRQIRFGPPGDYEDVASVGSRLYVLRSDGLLYEIQGPPETPRVTVHDLRLPTPDNEGLCFDARHGRLLIAAKSRLGPGRAVKDTRAIFAFDLDATRRAPVPVLLLDVDAVRAFAERKNRQLSDRQGKSGGRRQPLMRFMPSALALHPVTSEIFVLSAVDRVLASFDTNGQVTGCASLDPELFRQPEGITFMANGALIITNEAAGHQPTLLLFKARTAGSHVH
jgi:hypothetical protein